MQAGCSPGVPGHPDLLIVQTESLLAPITASLLPAYPSSLWGREHDGASQGLMLTFHVEAKLPPSAFNLKINGPHSFRARNINISLAQYLEISVLGPTSINQLYQLLRTIF